jgi:antitoxin HicB
MIKDNKTHKQEHIGSNFDKFLAENLMLDEVTAVAHKRVLAFQIKMP